MENKIDIGKAFREKIDQLEKSPSDNLWANIEKDLDAKTKRRLPLFWIFSSVLITSLFLGGVYFNWNSSNNTNAMKPDHSVANQNINGGNNKSDPNLTIKNQSDNTENKSIENVDPNPISTQEKISHSNSIVTSDNEDSSQKISAKKLTKNSSLVHDSTFAKKPKYKQNTNKSKAISNKAKTNNKSKTTFSYETTRLIKNTKRLVKSTEDYEEYEIVKQYTYIIKKKKKTHPLIKKSITSKEKRNDSTKKKKKPSKVSIKKNTPVKTLPEKSIIKDVVEITQEKKPVIDTITAPLKEEKTKKIEKKESKKIKTKDSLISKKEKKYALYITPYFGPSYTNSFNNTNSLSDKYNVSSKREGIYFNYGIYFRAMIAKKIGFRIGYGVINTKNATTILKQSDSFLDFRNIDFQITKTEDEINALFSNNSEVTFNQQISYSEIPLEAYYILKDGKFGMATALGASLLFLKSNELSIQSKTVPEFKIGKAKNLNRTSYTANLNLILSYKISDKINIELSPNLKYHLKGFDRANDFKPYIITLQTGLSYKY